MAYGTINAAVGPNNAGKTLACVVEGVVPAWLSGRKVVANLALFPERLGFDADLFEPLTRWRQIDEAEHCLLLLDEIGAVFPSRSFASMPPELQRVLQQLRKRDVEVWWSAPNWSRCDVILREVTQTVTECRSYLRARSPRVLEGDRSVKMRNEDGKKVRIGARWPQRRLFNWVTYDAQQYDLYQESVKLDAVKPMGTKHYWRCRKLEQFAYDTLAPVELLDHLDDVGVCVRCNRSRKKAYCSCAGAEASEAAEALH